MSLDELKNDLPETPGFIHSMIQKEVYNQVNNNGNVVRFQKSRKTKWNMRRVAVAVLVCIMGTTTVAYAGTKIYHMYLEHKAQYSVATGISSDDGAKKIELPKEIHDIKITAGYIPEGMEWMDENKLSYTDTPYRGGISISSVLMDKESLGITWLGKDVIESEELSFGEHDAVYVKFLDLKQDKSFDSRIFLLCPEEYRVLIIYFGDDVTKEDAIKFVQNMSITEKDEMIETKGLLTWSDMVIPAAEGVKLKNEIAEDKFTISNIGNTIPIGTMYKYVTGRTDIAGSISVCVEDVQIFDDLSILDSNSIPEDWKNAVSDDAA